MLAVFELSCSKIFFNEKVPKNSVEISLQTLEWGDTRSIKSTSQRHRLWVHKDFRLAVLPEKRALSAAQRRTCSRCRLLGSRPACRNARGALGQGALQGEEGAARRGGASELLPAPVSS